MRGFDATRSWQPSCKEVGGIVYAKACIGKETKRQQLRGFVRPLMTARRGSRHVHRNMYAKGQASGKNGLGRGANGRFTHVLSYSSDTLHVRIRAFSTRFGMSGWRPPWSITMPLTSLRERQGTLTSHRAGSKYATE